MRTETGQQGLRKDFSRSKDSALIAQRLVFILALSSMLFALCHSAKAQQPTKIPRIGYLSPNSLSSQFQLDRFEAFRQGLRQIGYVEGKSIVIDSLYAEGKQDRVPVLAAELVRLNVDIIVTGGSTATRAAKKATVTIPIVMSQDSDPVGNGFVASLARPGGNITGLSSYAAELGGKRLELLKEVLPRLSRVAVLGTSTAPQNARALKDTELAAHALGLKLQYLDVLGPRDIAPAFLAANHGRAEALIALNSFVLSAHQKQIIDLAVKSRLPTIHYVPQFVEAGGLMTYGVSLNELDRRAAIYVDKILKGAKPADLPVEQPKKFEFIVNLKTAKQIGVAIPPNVLARADLVIR